MLYIETTDARLEIVINGAQLEMGPSLTMDLTVYFPVPSRKPQIS